MRGVVLVDERCGPGKFESVVLGTVVKLAMWSWKASRCGTPKGEGLLLTDERAWSCQMKV